jgi:hypothetical protein
LKPVGHQYQQEAEDLYDRRQRMSPPEMEVLTPAPLDVPEMNFDVVQASQNVK